MFGHSCPAQWVNERNSNKTEGRSAAGTREAVACAEALLFMLIDDGARNT